MALHYALRRAASTVVPSAAAKFVSSAPRSSASAHRYLHNHQTSALFATAANGNISRNIFQRSSPSIIRQYSSRPSADESLLRVIDSEIQCAEESQESEQVEEVPNGFPFKIEDNPGEQTITLTREYHGENITVEVHMPDIITGEENENDNDEEGEEEKGSQPSLPLTVKVSKRGGQVLEFCLTAYPEEISIDTLSIKDPEISEDQIPYEGPDFTDLDEHLQKGFHKYLEVRGIKPSTTNFLQEYMVEKDGREYITWLKNLQKFVQA